MFMTLIVLCAKKFVSHKLNQEKEIGQEMVQIVELELAEMPWLNTNLRLFTGMQ